MQASSITYIEVNYPFWFRTIIGIPYAVIGLFFIAIAISIVLLIFIKWKIYMNNRFKIKGLGRAIPDLEGFASGDIRRKAIRERAPPKKRGRSFEGSPRSFEKVEQPSLSRDLASARRPRVNRGIGI